MRFDHLKFSQKIHLLVLTKGLITLVIVVFISGVLPVFTKLNLLNDSQPDLLCFSKYVSDLNQPSLLLNYNQIFPYYSLNTNLH